MMNYRPPPRESFEYSALISETTRMIWRYKFLWFFGLFAGTGTSLGGWNCSFSTGDLPVGEGSGFARATSGWFHAHLALMISLIAAAVFVLLLFWLWSLFCKGAVFESVRDSRGGRPLSFGAAFRHGREHFGRLLLFNLFLLLILAGLVVIIGAIFVLVAFLAASGGAGSIIGGILRAILLLGATGLLLTSFGYLTCISIWIVFPLLLVIVMLYAERAVVLEGLRPTAAIRRGAQILLGNIPQTLLLFLISLGLSIGAGIGVISLTIAAAIPSAISWIVAYNLGFPLVWTVVASVLILPVLLVSITVIAAVNTFFAVYWTDAYLRLSGLPRL
ncbi:hypothetical protein BMS3Abin01_01243 [bacterium BMS3Abin01]|nr:hypothetical protein BMS3Abin01_01243 [bacterium BMS3Abin01]